MSDNIFFFLFCGLKLDLTSVNKMIKKSVTFLYLRHSAIKVENWKMKNRFLILNFPKKIGKWKLKFFHHFSYFNFELKVKIGKNNFCISKLKWTLNGTFGARMSVYLIRVQNPSVYKTFIWFSIEFFGWKSNFDPIFISI